VAERTTIGIISPWTQNHRLGRLLGVAQSTVPSETITRSRLVPS